MSDSVESTPSAPRSNPRREMPIWRVPMWLNLVLMVAPFLILFQAFGRASFGDIVWLWGFFGVIALVMAIFGRRHPLARVHPLAWRARPWAFAGQVGFMWLVIGIASGWGVSPAYRAASLVAAALFVLLTTTGGEDAPLYRERSRRNDRVTDRKA